MKKVKFLNGKKNSYIVNETGSATVGKFTNGEFITDDEKLIERLSKIYDHQDVVETPPVQKAGSGVEEEDELPGENLDNLKADELKALMKEKGLTFVFGMTKDDMKEAIRQA